MEPRIILPCVNASCGTTELSRFLTALERHWASPAVILDFSRCTFLSAEGAALLAVFKLRRDSAELFTRIDWASVPEGVAAQLARWSLSCLFGKDATDRIASAVPLLHQSRLNIHELIGYVCKYLHSGRNMPTMTDPLIREVRRSLCELFQNAFIHAESPCGAVTIGQLYPRKKEVQLCVCDGGVGMVRCIQSAGFGLSKPADALAWALDEGTTTRKDSPGGLGLFFLSEFVRINGGMVRLVANNGYFSRGPAGLQTATLPVDFPGTLLQLKFIIRDDVVYTIGCA